MRHPPIAVRDRTDWQQKQPAVQWTRLSTRFRRIVKSGGSTYEQSDCRCLLTRFDPYTSILVDLEQHKGHKDYQEPYCSLCSGRPLWVRED